VIGCLRLARSKLEGTKQKFAQSIQPRLWLKCFAVGVAWPNQQRCHRQAGYTQLRSTALGSGAPLPVPRYALLRPRPEPSPDPPPLPVLGVPDATSQNLAELVAADRFPAGAAFDAMLFVQKGRRWRGSTASGPWCQVSGNGFPMVATSRFPCGEALPECGLGGGGPQPAPAAAGNHQGPAGPPVARVKCSGCPSCDPRAQRFQLWRPCSKSACAHKPLVRCCYWLRTAQLDGPEPQRIGKRLKSRPAGLFCGVLQRRSVVSPE